MEQRPRAFVVLNPVAGSSHEHAQQLLEDHFIREGWTVEIYEMTGKGQTEEVVRQSRARTRRKVDLFVAAGGDGTVSAAVGGLVHNEAPLGIVPLGTGNVLARELGIPVDLQVSLDLLTGTHRLRWIDVMRVGEDFFLLNVSVGVTAMTMRDTRRKDKRRFGRAAYVWTGLRKLLGYQPHRFVVVVDGQSSQLRASEVVIANCGAAGDPTLRWGPQVKLDDGQLDVHIIRARSALGYLRLFGAILLGRQRQDPVIRRLIAQESAAVSTDSSLAVQGDGEFIGKPPVMVELVRNAIQVVVPAEEEKRLDVERLFSEAISELTHDERREAASDGPEG